MPNDLEPLLSQYLGTDIRRLFLFLDDGKVSKYIPMAEVLQKAEKLFHPIDGYGIIQMMDIKNTKKLHKILTKDRFAPLTAELKKLSMDKILDI